MKHAARFLALVNDAKSRIRETNVAEVKKRLDAGEKLLIVDVREDNEWAAGQWVDLAESLPTKKAQFSFIGISRREF